MPINYNQIIENYEEELLPLWQEFLSTTLNFETHEQITALFKAMYNVQEKIQDIFIQEFGRAVFIEELLDFITALTLLINRNQFLPDEYLRLTLLAQSILINGEKYAESNLSCVSQLVADCFVNRVSYIYSSTACFIDAVYISNPVLFLQFTEQIPLAEFEEFYLFMIRQIKEKLLHNERLTPHIHLSFFNKRVKLPIKVETYRNIRYNLTFFLHKMFERNVNRSIETERFLLT